MPIPPATVSPPSQSRSTTIRTGTGSPNPKIATSDQNYLVMRIGLGDCLNFASSLSTTTLRLHSLFSCVFRGVALRPDVQDFLAHPEARLEHAADWLNNGLEYITDYGGKTENAARPLTVDWSGRTIRFPDGVNDAIRANVTRFVLPEEVPDTGALARYRKRWLGGILDQYKDSPTRIIFLQLPRGPLVNPHTHSGPGFVDSASKLPRVSVLPLQTLSPISNSPNYSPTVCT